MSTIVKFSKKREKISPGAEVDSLLVVYYLTFIHWGIFCGFLNYSCLFLEGFYENIEIFAISCQIFKIKLEKIKGDNFQWLLYSDNFYFSFIQYILKCLSVFYDFDFFNNKK